MNTEEDTEEESVIVYLVKRREGLQKNPTNFPKSLFFRNPQLNDSVESGGNNKDVESSKTGISGKKPGKVAGILQPPREERCGFLRSDASTSGILCGLRRNSVMMWSVSPWPWAAGNTGPWAASSWWS